MILQKIDIRNYKSIESLTIPITTVKNSYCFTLLGINESGKSSILKGISLIDSPNVSYPIDYFDNSKNIEITMQFNVEKWEEEKLKKNIKSSLKANDKFINKLKLKNVSITRTIENRKPNETINKERQKNGTFENIVEIEKVDSLSEKSEWLSPIIKGYTIVEDEIVESKDEEIDLCKMMEDYFDDFFWKESHSTIFWTSSPEYLITKPIELREFIEDPKGTSLPLFNSLKLLGLSEEKMKSRVEGLKTAADISNFEDELSDTLTKFIKNKWRKHPIKIKIKVNNHNLSFLVEDEQISYNAKVVSQRSDGFKQLVSFLLTVAAENNNDDFNYKILLLDEPEIHLHPSAQIDLLFELLKVSNSKDYNNIIFYATHSPYMIDRVSLNRSFKVTKKNNEKTEIEKIRINQTTFSEINYEIFDIPTTDYHNELYGLIEERKKSLLTGLSKDRIWFNSLKNENENVSSSTYIRHSIHHPENAKNRKYTLQQLRKSINLLRELRKKI